MKSTKLAKVLSFIFIICLSSSSTFAYATANKVVCQLFDMTVESLPCDPNGLFGVEIDFEFEDVSNSFNLTINGADYGEYFYIDLPISIGGLEGDGMTNYQFTVTDINDPTCSTLEQIGAINCAATPDNCVGFDNLEDGVDYGDLQNGEVLTTQNDIEVTVVGYNGNLFAYIEANIAPFCGSFPAADGIHIFMANGLNFNFSAVNNTSVSYDVQTCAAEGSFSIDGGDFINTYYSSDTTFNLSTGQLVTIVKNPDLDSEAKVTITGAVENLIIQGLELSLDNVCYSSEPINCEISDLVVTPQDCNTDGTYDILIDFNYANPGNDFFDVNDIFGNLLATYALADLPILHENLVPEGTEYDAIQVCINDAPNCCTAIEFLAPECAPPCELSNLTIVPMDCDGAFFSVIIDFDFTNTGSTFSVTGNGNDYGDFSYTDLPIIIGGLEGDGISGYEFLVTDNSSPNCSIFNQIQAVDCNPACEILGVDAFLECFSNRNSPPYYLNVEMEAQGADDLSFMLMVGTSAPLGPYAYSEFPLRIAINLNTPTLLIYAVEDEDCNFNLDLDVPDCTCGTSNYTYDFIACTSDGWELELDFDYSNPDEDFEIRDNDDNLLGTFNTSQLPIVLEAPLGNNNGFFPVRLHFCFLETECCTYQDFRGPFCNGECQIFNDNFTASDCIDDGTYNLTVDFDYESTNDSFYLSFWYFGDNWIEGPFAYANLPIELSGFEGDGNILGISIYDDVPNPSSGCTGGVDFQAPNCFGPDECQINEVSAEAYCDGDGDGDGAYTLVVDLVIENSPQDNEFNVNISGLGSSTYSLSEFPLSFEDYNFNTGTYGVTITDTDDPGCTGFSNFELPQCQYCVEFDNLEEGDCFGDLSIGDTLTIENDILVTIAGFDGINLDSIKILNGTPDYFPAASGNFVLIEDANGLNFDFSAIEGTSESVSYDFHALNPIGGFSINGGDFIPHYYLNTDTTFTVSSGHIIQITESPNINVNVTIIGAVENLVIRDVSILMDNICYNVAAPPCQITNFIATDLPVCNPDGGYDLTLDFNTLFVESDSFDLFNADNALIGTYALTDLPLTLENYEPFYGDLEVFYVCINDEPACCLTLTLQFPECPDNCEITDLIVEANDCDDNGQFTLDIDFNYTNTSDSFYVTVNTINQGTFAYTDLFVNVGPFDGNGEPLQVIVHDINDPDCWLQENIEAPVCATCNLDATAMANSCNDDGLFTLLYTTVNNDPNSDAYQVFVDGEFYGEYPYTQNTVEIGPLEGNGQDVVLSSVDVDDLNCTTSFTILAPDCPSPTCELSNPFNIYTCVDGFVYVLLEFEYSNTSDSFTVVENGIDYGTFAYTQIPVTIAPLPGDGQTFNFIITDQENPNCVLETTVVTNPCDPVFCSITNMETSDPECNPNGGYDLTLNFNYENPSNDFFDLSNNNGELIGTYLLSDLPITLENYTPSGNGFEVFYVCINDDSDCCNLLTVAFPECPSNCVISDLIVEVNDCDSNGQFTLDIDFDYTNTSDSFYVTVNAINQGTFAYTDLFVNVGPFDGNGAPLQVIVFDVNDPDCWLQENIEAPVCATCNLDATAMANSCNDDGLFTLLYTTVNNDPSSDAYQVFVDGEFYGEYPYTQNTVEVGPLEGNGQEIVLSSVDINDPDCSTVYTILSPDCTPLTCEIGMVIVEAYDCDPNGLFLVDLDFDFANTSDSFSVVGNGMNYGNFAYADLFITLGPFEGNGQTLEFIVTDLEFGDCQAEGVLQAPNCEPPLCSITDLNISEPQCNPDGGYDLTINFNVQNPSNDFFDLFDNNGALIGFYPLADLPITLENYTPSGGDLEVFQVCINDNSDCCNLVTVLFPECVADCEISDIVLEATDCDDDMGAFYIDIDFNTVNASDSFYVTVNTINQGYFAYEDLPITVGPFEGNGQAIQVIVTDAENPDCWLQQDIEAPVCYNCFLVSTGQVTDCSDDGTFFISYAIVNQDPNGEGYQLFINDDLYGEYTYDQSSLNIGPFEGNGQEITVSAIDINDPDCTTSYIILAPDCSPPACEIGTVIVEAYDCDPNGLFLVDLDFDFANTSDSFSVVGNGMNYGNFAYADLFITLGPFEGNGQTLEFIVTDLEFGDCQAEGILQAPNCEAPVCAISDLVATEPECNPDGGYDLTINFNVQNPASDSFNLFNGFNDLIGTYAISDLPIALENHIPYQGDIEFFQVCIIDAPNCCESLLLDFPECPSNCEIGTVIVEAYDCDPNGLFLVDLDFDFANTSDSFSVVGNGMNYGNFAYADLFITLGPFEGNGQTLEFIVTDLEFGDCQAEGILQAPNCEPPVCAISDLVATEPECNPDGGYDLTINFNVQNPGNDFFNLFDNNDDYIGTYALSDLPITLEDYTPSQDQLEVFTVCINDNPDCCETITVLFLECNEDCEISNLIIEPFCDGDGLYAEIIFEYNGNGSDSFQILSCAPIGNFAYNPSGVYTIEIPEELVNCAGGDFIPIGIFDLENDACGATDFLFIPDCYEMGCAINEVEAIVSDCDGDVFFVSIDFDFQDVGDDGFNVLGNGENYGDFEYNELPITLGPFAGNGQVLEFIITDNDDEDCWNFAEITAPNCASAASTCIQFEGLIDGLNYGGSNSQPGDLLMIENEVLVTIEGVPDPVGNLNYDYMFATTQDICNPFDAASGNRLFMFNGVKFDFSPLSQNPTLVTFPFHNCGIPFAMRVNEQQEVTYLFPDSDTTFNLSPSVVIDIDVDINNPEEGFITLQGFVESFFIGGVELQIDNVCFNVENLTPEVWPGDANFDNIANNFDLLNVGIAFGSDGPERDMSNIDWFAMPADDWVGFFADEETNFKHADCDGDGVVLATDQNAILENYNLDHGPVPIFVQVPGTPNDPPFFVDLPEANDIELGELFEAPIILGSAAIPVDEIYGIAFTVEFSEDMMDETQVTIEIGDSWMGLDGQNLIHLEKSFAVDGKIDVAIVRTNQENVGGFGTVGNFIGIIDDILGKTEVEVDIINVKAIDVAEVPVPLNIITDVVDLATNTTDLIEGSIDIYPNPTSDIINIDNQTNEFIQNIEIYNVLGQLITSVHQPNAYETINVSDWAAGVYFVKVELESGILTQRVKKSASR